MLKKLQSIKVAATDGTFAIVASRYNTEYVDALLRAARAELQNAGARIRIVRVPGAFEIPAVAARLAHRYASTGSRGSRRTARIAAILCFGVIFQGETPHAQHISWGVTHALAQIQVQYRIPIIHGVFLFEKVKHARVRCLGAKHNRGTEAARTALEMARVMHSLKGELRVESAL